jgi:hypothetical protein
VKPVPPIVKPPVLVPPVIVSPLFNLSSKLNLIAQKSIIGIQWNMHIEGCTKILLTEN